MISRVRLGYVTCQYDIMVCTKPVSWNDTGPSAVPFYVGLASYGGDGAVVTGKTCSVLLDNTQCMDEGETSTASLAWLVECFVDATCICYGFDVLVER